MYIRVNFPGLVSANLNSTSFISTSFISTVMLVAALSLGAPAFANSDADNSEITTLTAAQNSPRWKVPRTPQSFRIGINAGDHGGGPVRYNTRFPEVKSDPHPASYYHGPAFAAVEVEFVTSAGGLILQVVTRRDLWHKAIAGRSVTHEGEIWSVDAFHFADQGAYLGWMLGERYREAPWMVDFGLMYEQALVTAKMSTLANPERPYEFKERLDACSARARAQFCTTGSGTLQACVGPEIYIPLFSRKYDGSQAALYGWVSDQLQLKNSAAVGLTLGSSLRF